MIIPIDIPDNLVPRAIPALCSNHGYDGTGTQAAFAKQQFIEWLKYEINKYETKKLEDTSKADLDAAKAALTAEISSLNIT